MRKTYAILAGLALLLLAIAVPVAAHHAFGAEFDRDAPIKLEGPIVKLEWVNPHTWIHLEVTQEDGTKEVWAVEGGTPNVLLRRGLRRDCLTPGTEIVVDGVARFFAWLHESRRPGATSGRPVQPGSSRAANAS